MSQPKYRMSFNGFTGKIKKSELVVVEDTTYGVSLVKTEDGRRDFAHMNDLKKEVQDEAK